MILNKKRSFLINICILLVGVLFFSVSGCGESNSDFSTDSSLSYLSASSSDEDSSSNGDNEKLRLKKIMETDTKNDEKLVDAVLFDTDTFGEYFMKVTESGNYSFSAVNIPGGETAVFWNVYIFEKECEYGTDYIIKNFEPSVTTDGNIALYNGQYVYCICSINQYNYNTAYITAYLKIRMLNAIDDSQHVVHTHDFNVKVDASSCTSAGYIIYECACGETYIESIAPTGHNYKSEITPATCTTDGYITYSCTKCHSSYIEAGEKATGHRFNKDSLSSTASEHSFTCNDCGKKIIETHNFSKTAYITGMTDNSGNVKYYTITLRKICSVCGYSTPAETPDVTHVTSTYSYDGATGILSFTCNDCGACSYKCDISLDMQIVS